MPASLTVQAADSTQRPARLAWIGLRSGFEARRDEATAHDRRERVLGATHAGDRHREADLLQLLGEQLGEAARQAGAAREDDLDRRRELRHVGRQLEALL